MKIYRCIVIIALFIIINTIQIYAYDTLTIDKAYEMAFSNSNELKKMEENQELNENDYYLTNSSVLASSETESLQNLFMSLKSLKNEMLYYNDDKKLQEEKIKYNLYEIFYCIDELEKDIEIKEDEILLMEKKLNIDEKKYSLGVISKSQYENTLAEYKSLLLDRDNMIIDFNDSYSELNKLIGVDLDSRFTLSYELDYGIIDIDDVYVYINKAISKSKVLEKYKINSDEIKYSLSLIKSSGYGGDKDEVKNKYIVSQSEYADIKKSMEESIIKIYNNIKVLEEKYNTNLKELNVRQAEKAFKDKQLELNLITEIEMYEYEFNIKQIEKEIEEIKKEHELLKMQLYNIDLVNINQ